MNASVDNVEQARCFLRNEPPCGALQMREIFVDDAASLNRLASVQAFCADLRKHTSIKGLFICDAEIHTAPMMRALVDAAIALQLECVNFYDCGCTPDTVPELTRLVSAGSVRKLHIDNDDELFKAGANTNQFCAAVRASS